jgi:cellulose synthase/poly-beta-1,6-N-acetylglucosamine synthase-like glycosyltransferase
LAEPSFSIVIPVHRDGPAFRRCLEGCLALDYPRFEVVAVTDRPLPSLPEGVLVVETRSSADTSPAEKRDAAFPVTSGDVLAFIDDDAYPARDWLRTAAGYFGEPSVKALGGPGLTPPDSSWRERVGGAVYESPMGSAQLRHRFVSSAPRRVNDYPAYNFFVRREALQAVSGWGTTFYGGEDTILCLKLARAGWRVVYAPDVIAFHTRRRILLPHLRQVANVGRHRGYFLRAYPETSRRPLYALPVLAPAVLAFAALFLRRRAALASGLFAAVYGGTAAETLRRHPLSVAAVTPAIIVAHHLAYGVSVLRGLFSRRLTR